MAVADDHLHTWFDHLHQLRRCVGSIRTGLPTAEDQLPEFFCEPLPTTPVFSEMEKTTLRACMSNTGVAPLPADFQQAATFAALLDRRDELQPRILAVMRLAAIDDGICDPDIDMQEFAALKSAATFPTPQARGKLSRRLRRASHSVLPVPSNWGPKLATPAKTNEDASREAASCG